MHGSWSKKIADTVDPLLVGISSSKDTGGEFRKFNIPDDNAIAKKNDTDEVGDACRQLKRW